MPVIIAKDAVREPLYCIVPVQNAWRWKARWKHTDRAIKHFMDSGAVVILVEAAFNRRELVYADSGLDGTRASCGVMGTDKEFRHRYVPLRSSSELWLKENLVNVAVSRVLPFDWQQLCYLDGDIHFVRPNWVGECIHKLQHYDVLQMFSHARDLGPSYEVLPEDYPHANGISFVEAWRSDHFKPGVPISGDRQQQVADGGYYMAGQERVWPGLAWAFTRHAWDSIGGLLDFAVWGGGDYHMAHCFIEKQEGMMRDDLHQNYKQLVTSYFKACQRKIRQNIGVMSGSVFHSWHGKKSARGYNAKHSLLAKAGFDPIHHLKRDYQGLYQLHDDGTDSFVKLRDWMRRVAMERNEDSIETGLPHFDQGH